MLSQFKNFFKRNEADIILVVGIVLISLISFGGGWIMATNSKFTNENLPKTSANEKIKVEENTIAVDSAKSKNPTISENTEGKTIKAEINEESNDEAKNNEPEKNQEESETQETKNISSSSTCKYVGSKNSDIYHLPECPGAQRIKEENKRCFSSKNEAEKAGYRPAKNCPGI